VIDDAEQSLSGVVITHPHPDHYAGLWHVIGDADIPVVATRVVDEVIRRDDVIKQDIVGPMMGAEWPTKRLFPNHTVHDGAVVTLGGVALQVDDLGPGESHVDSLWRLDPQTIFAGDIAYNGMHAYLADGHWETWLALLSRLDLELPNDVALHIGHGPAGGKELLRAQRRYIEAFVTAIGEHSAAIEAGDHAPVVSAMTDFLPNDALLFLMELSIDPVHAALQQQ
jgi:glyoxylase-like metal-dependent hydrolase (beta-lactamase superfamily II)